MSKGIAVNTILYLLLGVLVVGIVIYLVYTYALGPGMSIQDCRSRVQNWCNSCKIAGWAAGFGAKLPASSEYTCIKTHFATGTINVAGIDCSSTFQGAGGDTKTFCEQLAG